MNRRADLLRDDLPPEVDAFLVSDPVGLRWTTGFAGSFGHLVITRDGGRFLTDSRYTLQAEEQVAGFEVRSFASPKKGEEFLRENLAEMGVRTLGVQATKVSHQGWLDWTEKLGVALAPVKGLVDERRRVKDEGEVGKIRDACRLADAALEHVLRIVREGVTEHEVALEIEFFFRRHGAKLAFEVIAVSGERSARPHGTPSMKALEPGDFLTMDFGAELDGYCSDLTRTIVIGEPTARHREVYDAVLRAQLAALEAMRPGVRAADVDGVARAAMGDHARHFGHGLGHGLGMLVHDGGGMGAASEDVLAEGQVWTVEPGIYVPGFGGVRIEDDVVVRAGGIENLTGAPKELISR